MKVARAAKQAITSRETRSKSAFEHPYAPVRRLGRAGVAPRAPNVRALVACADGYDLHAGVRVAAQHPEQRDALERLMRYCARPPLSDDRLLVRPDGRVLLELKTPWHDGTTHRDLDPLDFLAGCAALIPRPHKNLVVYHGVLAAHARLRARAVDHGRASQPTAGPLRFSAIASLRGSSRPRGISADQPTNAPRRHSRHRGSWGDLMRRAFGYDLLTAPAAAARWRASLRAGM